MVVKAKAGIRVILTCNYSPWSPYCGGGQVSTDCLARALHEAGHHVTVVFTKAPRERIEPPTPVPYQLRWAALPGRRSTSDVRFRYLSAVTVCRAVKRELSHVTAATPVVVHSQGEEGTLIPLALPSIPWILTPRYPSYPPSFFRSPPRRFELARQWVVGTKYMMLRAMARRANCVCPTSEAAAEMVAVALQVPPERIRVVPNGIHPAFTKVVRRTPAGDAPIMFFGRVTLSKGVDTLLAAYAEASPSCPLVVIGEGAWGEEARNRVNSLGLGARVRFETWHTHEQLARKVSEARFAVLPSREESFGNSIAETIAAGTPLITTRVGSVPSIAEGAATLVEPANPRELARAIEAMFQTPGPYEDRARDARARILSRYSWEATARTFAGLYEDACNSVPFSDGEPRSLAH